MHEYVQKDSPKVVYILVQIFTYSKTFPNIITKIPDLLDKSFHLMTDVIG